MPAFVRRPDLTQGEDDKAGHRERLRERMIEGGADAFLDYELLEYMLGLAIPRRDTKPLAKLLITEFGSFAAAISAEPAALGRVVGLGETGVAALKFVQAAAIRLVRAAVVNRPVIGGWEPLIQYLHAAQAHGINEQVRVLYLNSKNILIRDEVLSDGMINQATVHTREVLRRALVLGAAGLILVHNHPSGDPTPSRADITLTKEIMAAAQLLEIIVHDHIIVGHNGHSSLRALGHMV